MCSVQSSEYQYGLRMAQPDVLHVNGGDVTAPRANNADIVKEESSFVLGNKHNRQTQANTTKSGVRCTGGGFERSIETADRHRHAGGLESRAGEHVPRPSHAIFRLLLVHVHTANTHTSHNPSCQQMSINMHEERTQRAVTAIGNKVASFVSMTMLVFNSHLFVRSFFRDTLTACFFSSVTFIIDRLSRRRRAAILQ